MRPRKTVRLRHFDYLGRHRYLFTICTRDRRRTFVDGIVVSATLSKFVQSAEAERIAIPAYCFMPDHLHVLAIGLEPTSDAMKFVAMSKQLSGYHHARMHGAQLWQRYSWDRVLRSDEDTMTAVRYVLANPVRAGLVTRPADYPYSGSLTWSRDELAEMLWAG